MKSMRNTKEDAFRCRSAVHDHGSDNGYTETVCLPARNHTEHHMKLNAEPFQKIYSGQKTIELRLLDEKRQKLRVGDTIVFTCSDKTERQMKAQIAALHCFKSFEDLYRTLPLLKCEYTEENVSQAHFTDMEAYYPAEEQKKYGVVGIEIFPPMQIKEGSIVLPSRKDKGENNM